MSAVLERAGQCVSVVELTPIGWNAADDLPYEEWLRQGTRLGVAARSAAWWVGDWVRFGTARYGDKYGAAARITGYDRQTLMNMVYVAGRYSISRRRENLSWSHHAELAPLRVDEQELWLDRAADERLSVRDLRELLPPRPTGDRASVPARNGASTTATRSRKAKSPVHERVCPSCGHRFTQ